MDLVLNIISETVGTEVQPDSNSRPPSVTIKSEKILDVCRRLHTHPGLYFDMLSCLTGLDNGPEAKTMEVIYNLYSMPFDKHLMLKVVLPRENPEIDSVASVWATANWHEREAFDMFGIKFNNHPDLRRILLPADWEGFPLRKDYKHQEKYRGIIVEHHNK